jgi:hypothetical protein
VTAILDVRTYRLVQDGRAEFDRIFRAEALPLLRAHGIRVVAFGPSLADQNGYTLIRSFSSPSEREDQLGSFYSSPDWIENFDQRVGALIESYQVVVIEVPDGALTNG